MAYYNLVPPSRHYQKASGLGYIYLFDVPGSSMVEELDQVGVVVGAGLRRSFMAFLRLSISPDVMTLRFERALGGALSRAHSHRLTPSDHT